MSDDNSDDGRTFLHAILGDGKMTELMLWKNKIESGVMLVGLSVIWLLFEVLDYNFVTFICHLLIILMLLLLFWNKFTLIFTNWSPLKVEDFEISESTLQHLFVTFNWLLRKFFEISSAHDFKLFAMLMGSLWLLSVIGELINSMNLMYIVFVSLQIMPIVYEKYEEEIHKVTSQLKSNMGALFHTIDSNFLSKIPKKNQIKQN